MNDNARAVLEEETEEEIDHLKTWQDRIIAALVEKMGDGGTFDCPITGPTTWTVGGYTTALPALEDPVQSPTQHSPRIPLAVVMCDCCGYTFFVNLVLLGLMNGLDSGDADS